MYLRGNKNILNEKAVAIIGTTEPTENGKIIARRLADIFSKEYGYVIVSGLALGYDTAAQTDCIEAKGKTVAVMPCGPDIISPASNKELAERIIQTGRCLISEYTPGTQPIKAYYVRRGRLQSGLSRAVIVVESEEDGETLETVKHGISQNKVIACYIRNKDIPQMKGNFMFVSRMKALPLSDHEDIVKLANCITDDEWLKKAGENLC